MKPIIGIIVCGYAEEKQFVSQNYIEAMERSGALPVLLPILTLHDTPFVNRKCHSRTAAVYQNYKQYCDICDGFLFCGGDDITPVFFDDEPKDVSGLTDIKTDIFHLSFMEYVLPVNKPILAICRGMQILNVALGGSIYQDISFQSADALSHMQHSLKRSDISHRVHFTGDGILHSICGDSTYTNSFHHQSVRTPGRNLRVTGRTSDGTIESLESDRHPFVVGVQWHPECMYSVSPEMQELFHRFVNAASNSTPIQMDNEVPSRHEVHPSTPSF